MKKSLFSTVVFCCSILAAYSQGLSYEYLLYKKDDRKGTVQLPDFTVSLKKHLRPEKTVYKEPSKMFVVSDLEGEYEQFKGLLQAAGVIDEKFHWTYDKGHLVVIGDVFDRGAQVTECLWLLYHLEDQAKDKGGYVHYVLGNHELMNLNGDYRYLNPKYPELARQAGVGYAAFYSGQTELGRWLRTKNVVEKIGDHLFVHGGISQYMNRWAPPIDSINLLAQTYYDKPDSSIPQLEQILFSDYGPMWYRGYYLDPQASINQVDSTLQIYRVKKIVTGHTSVPRISSFFNGKVINVDVPHAKGVSEGLLIENKQYFRVTKKGEIELLTFK